MSFTSYAQNLEDVFLHRVFGGQETGFYVDVGAYHPVEGSITKSFYDRGWNGINVEPGSVFEELAAARTRDVNLQIAVLDRTGEAMFVEDGADRGMSHVVDDSEATARTVRCDTLDAIVRQHARGRPIDFIKIDAEGAEAAIVRSTDWLKLRPRVLVLEATLPWSNALANQEWEPTLLEQGYSRAYFDGINCFYVANEQASTLQRHFQIPINALDRVTRYDPRSDATRRELESMAVELAAARERVGTLEAEHVAHKGRQANLQTANYELQAERDLLVGECEAHRAERLELVATRTTMQRDRNECLARLASLKTKSDEVLVQLATMRQERDEALAQIAMIRQEHDEVLAQVAALRQERDALSNPRDKRTPTYESSEEPSIRGSLLDAVAGPPFPSSGLSRNIPRRAAKAAYGVLRPVLRPLAWRTRTFLLSDIGQQVQWLGEKMRALECQAERANAHVVAADRLRILEPHAVAPNGDEGAMQLRRLAGEMEKVVLTLAMEAAHGRSSSVSLNGIHHSPIAQRRVQAVDTQDLG